MPDFSRFKIRPQTAFKLSQIAPDDTAGIDSKQAGDGRLERNVTRLSELQYRLAAENKRALLIILQGMDAGGKDGTIRHVMTGLNPQGCRVVSFKVPAGVETRHDYLWRIHAAAPGFGEIGIFNRSHYEDVLVVRVHDLVPKAVWSQHYEQINAFEKMLVENGTTILKFFLHISRGEQKKRLEARIDDPSKNWKFSEADVAERKHWKDYQEAYQDAIRKCSTPWAPWYVVPADRKWFRNLVVSEVIADALQAMKLKMPKPSVDLTKISFD